jgi:DNA processing protein
MMETLAATTKKQLLERSDARFPEGLDLVEPPSERLFVLGDIDILSMPALAIVGARKATPYGLSCATRFAKLAAAQGLVIVSGGALGCDQAAHTGALAVGGRTVVVLGCGADVVYPANGKDLFERVLATGGAIISEAPWGSHPSRWGFRRRNRVIAGLGRATLIVEAGMPSGTFSTADATLSQGKEVLAIPGSIFAKESKGANHLIAEGAIPIVDDNSFCEALTRILGMSILPLGCQSAPKAQSSTQATGAVQQQVLVALSQEPLRAERLVGICGEDVIEVIRYLSALELAGFVSRLRDGRFASAYQ